jgi:hypothetical protein
MYEGYMAITAGNVMVNERYENGWSDPARSITFRSLDGGGLVIDGLGPSVLCRLLGRAVRDVYPGDGGLQFTYPEDPEGLVEVRDGADGRLLFSSMVPEFEGDQVEYRSRSDGRRRRWIAVDIDLLHTPFGKTIMEEFATGGLVAWVSLLGAAKKSHIEGTVHYRSEEGLLAELGLLDVPLVRPDGEPWRMETYLKRLGQLRKVRNRRRGGVRYVTVVRWALWQQSVDSQQSRERMTRSRAENIRTKSEQSPNDVRTDIDIDNDNDKDISLVTQSECRTRGAAEEEDGVNSSEGDGVVDVATARCSECSSGLRRNEAGGSWCPQGLSSDDCPELSGRASRGTPGRPAG